MPNCRLKKVVSGIHKKHTGKFLSAIKLPQRKPYIEVIGDIGARYEDLLTARVIGFWNSKDKKYHWYITNLKCPTQLIYPLYKLRWQIELLFKTVKSSFHFDELLSANKNIIENLLFIKLCAAFIALPLYSVMIQDLDLEKQLSISIQKAGMIFCHLAEDIKTYLKNYDPQILKKLFAKIKALSIELFNPNYRKKTTTLGLCQTLLEGL